MREGCQDRFCYLTGPRTGQVTNGGCRCVREQPARAALMRLWRENEKLRAALVKLRNCDWVITPADRMDAVREIAREALGDE